MIDEETVLFFSSEIVPRDADMKGKFIQHFTGEESDTKCISTTSNVRQLALANVPYGIVIALKRYGLDLLCLL